MFNFGGINLYGMIKKLFVILLLTSGIAGLAQEYKISGTITGLENESVYLMQLMGEKRSIIDTAQTDITGAFTFIMPENREPGMYVVIKGPGQAVELIYNKEDIQFTASETSADGGIQVISSVENLIYYDYLGIKGINMYKIDVLKPLIANYPPSDEFYFEALKQNDRSSIFVISISLRSTSTSSFDIFEPSIRVEAPTLLTVAIDFNCFRLCPSLFSIEVHDASNLSI